MVSSEVFGVERDGHVATLWLDSADRRNAMGSAFFADLPAIVTALSGDPDVRAVVLAARGPAFCVGLDLKEMGGLLGAGEAAAGETKPSDAVRNTRVYQDVRRMQASLTAVADCPKPVIAAVHGWCIGGGVDLIACCDIRLASADARFSVRETKVAIVPDLGTLQRLPGIVARGHVAELTYTGKDVTAARAAEIGLVNDVLPDVDALHDAARTLAEEIAANSPLAVQGAKRVLRAGEGLSVEEGLDYVALWNTSFVRSHDLAEAMTAFFEKRPPRFTGG